jgi:lysophospholipase L1-like esterase
VALGFFLVVLGVLEGSARLFYREDRELYAILDVLEEDPVLFWRLRPGLDVTFHGARTRTNSLGLRGPELSTDRPAGTWRILCLGESPTFGWGVEEEDRYSDRLREKLAAAGVGGGKVEVVNSGVIGYTSHQGVGQLARLLPLLKPDVVTVPYAVNDIDKYRFFRNNGQSDKALEFAPKGLILSIVSNALARSRSVRVWQRGLAGWDAAEAEFRAKCRAPFTDARRVSADEYRENLRAIRDAAARQGARVVFVKMPMHDPFEARPPSPAADRSRAAELFASAERLADASDWAGAAAAAEESLRLDPASARRNHLLGQWLARQGDRDGARAAFGRAKKEELRECLALVGQYGAVMDGVSAETGVPLADAAARFRAVAPEARAALFNEPGRDLVHPSPRGHEVIAEELYRVFIDRHLLERTGTNP